MERTQAMVETTLASTHYQSTRDTLLLGSKPSSKLNRTPMNMDIFTSLTEIMQRPIRAVVWNSPISTANLVLPHSTRIVPATANAPTIYVDFIRHFSTCFRYWHGGMIYSLRGQPGSDTPINPLDLMEIQYRYDTFAFASTAGSGINSADTFYPSTFYDFSRSPMAVVHVPTVSTSAALFNDATGFADASTAAGPLYYQSDNVCAGVVNVRYGSHAGLDVVVYRSVAPDFVFSFFVGVPPPPEVMNLLSEQLLAMHSSDPIGLGLYLVDSLSYDDLAYLYSLDSKFLHDLIGSQNSSSLNLALVSVYPDQAHVRSAIMDLFEDLETDPFKEDRNGIIPSLATSCH
jgi:hypothetical protein